MPAIDEKHRPRTWGEVAGNERAVKLCRILAESVRDTGAPEVALLSGPSGIGKTTCALIMARTAGAHPTQITVIESGACTIDRLRDLADGFCYTSLFGARAVIIEEVDTATPAALKYLLTFLESLPRNSIVIMTSNVKPGELFAGVHQSAFGRRAHPIPFTTQGLATRKGQPGPGALRVRAVMAAEGLDGREDSYYIGLVHESHGNIGAALTRAWREAVLGD